MTVVILFQKIIENNMKRGRPSEQPAEVKEKWTQEWFDVPTKHELGCKHTWHYDNSKTTNGPWKTEITYPKSFKPDKFKPQKGKAYNKMPVVMVFKTSNRSNAKTKMKIWANENIDYITSAKKLPGVPDTAIILELGVGKGFIDKWRSKHNL
jgi:hypothetical protein|tara:strand:- start:1514 stop:1969 length:456 start_codon:yes stop_codon:yes gene_type:complete